MCDEHTIWTEAIEEHLGIKANELNVGIMFQRGVTSIGPELTLLYIRPITAYLYCPI